MRMGSRQSWIVKYCLGRHFTSFCYAISSTYQIPIYPQALKNNDSKATQHEEFSTACCISKETYLCIILQLSILSGENYQDYNMSICRCLLLLCFCSLCSFFILMLFSREQHEAIKKQISAGRQQRIYIHTLMNTWENLNKL